MQAYSTPVYGSEDWLNEFYDAKWRAARQGALCGLVQLPCSVCRPDNRAAADTHTPDPVQSDYRFCYLGPAGSSTPVHADVLRSFSWSVNVCGRKVGPSLPRLRASLSRG